jgi:hypothetical protein
VDAHIRGKLLQGLKMVPKGLLDEMPFLHAGRPDVAFHELLGRLRDDG